MTFLFFFLLCQTFAENYFPNEINFFLHLFFFSELNELRKPSADNPDILRFFRYMRAAKDGQDGLDCKCKLKYFKIKFLISYDFSFYLGEISYKECTTFNDMSGPAMINTFNDINKLVMARKMRSL